ncbi:TetR/AcrR family transcriptional regulator [Roseburia hominis]
MPPKAKITKEMVIDAAFEVTRAEGAQNVNARTVSKKLGCSTQPIMYHFTKIEDMKRAVYEKVGQFHTEYLLNINPKEDVMLGIGLNYIRFAVEEPNLFRFLFQSGFAVENNLLEMVDSEELKPIISAMQEAIPCETAEWPSGVPSGIPCETAECPYGKPLGTGLDTNQIKEVFITLAMFVHGYASIIANNALEYDERVVTTHLERAYRGAILALQEEKDNE